MCAYTDDLPVPQVVDRITERTIEEIVDVRLLEMLKEFKEVAMLVSAETNETTYRRASCGCASPTDHRGARLGADPQTDCKRTRASDFRRVLRGCDAVST